MSWSRLLCNLGRVFPSLPFLPLGGFGCPCNLRLEHFGWASGREKSPLNKGLLIFRKWIVPSPFQEWPVGLQRGPLPVRWQQQGDRVCPGKDIKMCYTGSAGAPLNGGLPAAAGAFPFRLQNRRASSSLPCPRNRESKREKIRENFFLIPSACCTEQAWWNR